MEQGQSAAQIFVNNGIGGAGDGIPIAQPPSQSPGEGGFPRTQIHPVDNDRPSGQPLSQRRPDFSVSSGECVMYSNGSSRFLCSLRFVLIGLTQLRK